MKKKNKNSFIKKYIWHILNILSIVLIGLPFVILLINDGEFSTSLMISMIFMGIVIIFMFFEMIYFIVRVANKKEIENKAVKCILIYLFGFIYIPYVYVKYLYDGEKKKNDGIIYLIVSIILYVLLCILVFGVAFYLEFNNSNSSNRSEIVLSDETYTTEAEDIKITLPKDYTLDEDPNYDVLFNANENSIVGILFYRDDDQTLEENMNTYESIMFEEVNDLKIIDKNVFNDKTKNILNHTYKYTTDDGLVVEDFSIIKFNEKDRFYVLVFELCFEEDYDPVYKDAFKKIVKSIELNK